MEHSAHRPGPASASGTGRRPWWGLVAFFALAFAFTWVFTVPAGLGARGVVSLPVPPLALLAVGGFGPLLAAVVLAARRNGRAGVRALFAQLDPRGVPRRWFVVPMLFVGLNLLPVAGHLVAGGTLPDSGTVLGILLVFPAQLVLVALVGGGLDEEMGWRGHALPHWLRLSSPVVASVLLGVVWSLWHLPLWLDPHSSQAAYPFAIYLLKTVGQSVLIGWMYCGSGGSLTVAILAHAVANATDGMRYQLLADHRGDLAHQLVLMGAVLVAAGVVILLTRGRLGADRLGLDPPGSTGLLPHDRSQTVPMS